MARSKYKGLFHLITQDMQSQNALQEADWEKTHKDYIREMLIINPQTIQSILTSIEHLDVITFYFQTVFLFFLCKQYYLYDTLLQEFPNALKIKNLCKPKTKFPLRF